MVSIGRAPLLGAGLISIDDAGLSDGRLPALLSALADADAQPSPGCCSLGPVLVWCGGEGGLGEISHSQNLNPPGSCWPVRCECDMHDVSPSPFWIDLLVMMGSAHHTDKGTTLGRIEAIDRSLQSQPIEGMHVCASIDPWPCAPNAFITSQTQAAITTASSSSGLALASVGFGCVLPAACRDPRLRTRRLDAFE